MVPVDGPVREGVGLLGSPAFEIPRTVERDASVDQQLNGEAKRLRLAAKNRYNLRTIGVMLLSRSMGTFLLALIAVVAGTLYGRFGDAAVVVAFVVAVPCGLAYGVFVERAALAFQSLAPASARSTTPTSGGTSGTGRRSRRQACSTAPRSRPPCCGCWASGSDGGCSTTALLPSGGSSGSVTAARSTPAARSGATHKRTARSSRIGRCSAPACTLGVGALIHYGVRIGDGAVIATDSFLMKGEEVPPRAHWGGNPAGEMP